jgi:hypothetical protein
LEIARVRESVGAAKTATNSHEFRLVDEPPPTIHAAASKQRDTGPLVGRGAPDENTAGGSLQELEVIVSGEPKAVISILKLGFAKVV